VTEVAVVGAPFLDFTFEGLERVPHIGEELIASRLHIAPGGSGMQAIGAARLGVETALIAPLGNDGVARIVREFLAAEGVVTVGRRPETAPDKLGVPVTALLRCGGGVAMATGLGGFEPDAADVAEAGGDALVASLGRIHLAPPGTTIYAVTGAMELTVVRHELAARLRPARALILNSAEAMALARRPDPAEAALHLGRLVPTAIVTMGADGVVAAHGDNQLVRVVAPVVDEGDATGAGDLFVAAFVWADLRGATLPESLGWACLYAGLSVRTPTAFSGALHLHELMNEGRARGLNPPPKVSLS
jgi:sugar/nucleoside kinase (ribokinase family)